MSKIHLHVLSASGQPEAITSFKKSYRHAIREIINYPITHHAAENDLIEFISIDPMTNKIQSDVPHWDSAKSSKDSSKLMYPYVDPRALHQFFDTIEITTDRADFIELKFNTYIWDFVGVLLPLSIRFPNLNFLHLFESGFGNYSEYYEVISGEVYDYKFESASDKDPFPFDEEDRLSDDLPNPKEIAVDLSCFEKLRKHKK